MVMMQGNLQYTHPSGEQDIIVPYLVRSREQNLYSESGMRRVLGEVDVGATGNHDDRNG
jgi:hypothetical protein